MKIAAVQCVRICDNIQAMPISAERIAALVSAFLEENAKLNLSAFRTEEHCRIGNVEDSLALLDANDCKGVQSILDLGTGGGFPLLPLAMALPNAKVVGIDSVEKKVAAIRRIVQNIRLSNVELIIGRIEELAHRKELRESFDLVTARAVAPLPVLLEYAIPFLRLGGIAAFWKSTKIAEELASTANAQKILKAEYVDTFTYTLPGNFGQRCIVFFRKAGPTSSEFPRKTGTPKKEPL